MADPNYPGQKDRYCELGAKSFKPYSSGANAADIDANGAVLYTEMHFIASSALINFSTIAENYEKMLVGSIGDNEFPRSSFQVMTKYDEDITKVVWSNVNKNKVVLTKEYYDLLPSDMKNLALVRVTPQAPDLVYSLYLNNNTSPEQNPVYIILEENIYYEISLNEGENNIAFLVEQINNGHYSYVDFVRINIDCSDEKAESETKVVTTQKPKSSKAVKIVCAFSDNYKYNPDIVTKECKAGDSFPYDYIDALKPPISGHKFGGYFTDPSFEKPLSYTTVPNEDVYVYILWTKMSLSEMLGKYEDAKPQDYLDYNYYEFIADGTVKHVYKYKDKTDIYTSKGTWTYRETPYQDYSISSLDVKMETSSFPLQFVVYEDRVREGGGKEYFRK